MTKLVLHENVNYNDKGELVFQIESIRIDKETAIQLLDFLSHEYISHESYERIHELIKRMNEFVEAK